MRFYSIPYLVYWDYIFFVTAAIAWSSTKTNSDISILCIFPYFNMSLLYVLFRFVISLDAFSFLDLWFFVTPQILCIQFIISLSTPHLYRLSDTYCLTQSINAMCISIYFCLKLLSALSSILSEAILGFF